MVSVSILSAKPDISPIRRSFTGPARMDAHSFRETLALSDVNLLTLDIVPICYLQRRQHGVTTKHHDP